MEYIWWNDALANYFFKSENAGRQIFLYITDNLLDQIGSAKGVGRDDFLAAVRIGPTGVNMKEPCLRALEIFKEWRKSGFDWPPYIAYLATFSLAAGLEGDYPEHAYYNRLRNLLHEPPGTTLPYFEKMNALWKDLEVWSNRDKSGELGIFTVRTVGKWRHVGIPKAQSILTEFEQKSLIKIFILATLDPTSTPSDKQLAYSIAYAGNEILRKKSIDLLLGAQDTDFERRKVLIEVLAEELLQWDGITPIDISEKKVEKSNQEQSIGYVRICGNFDRVKKRIDTNLRCSFGGGFPDGEISLIQEKGKGTFICEEELPGWSSFLLFSDTGEPVKGTDFDWIEGDRLYSKQQDWQFRFPSSLLRIFIEGICFGLPGLIEVQRAPINDAFYIAMQNRLEEEIVNWAKQSCENIENFGNVQGLPDGWKLLRIQNIKEDTPISNKYPILSLPSETRIHLKGGVRSGRGNNFFWFCPPRIILETPNTKLIVYCNGSPSLGDRIGGLYNLHAFSTNDKMLYIEAKDEKNTYVNRKIYLEKACGVIISQPQGKMDKFGRFISPTPSEVKGIAGALCNGIDNIPFDFSSIQAPLVKGKRIYLIGREVGQIISYPKEPWPVEWDVIWQVAIINKNCGKAFYCGMNYEKDFPKKIFNGNRKQISQWKEILWYSRKRIAPPAHPSNRNLWRLYQEVAKNV